MSKVLITKGLTTKAVSVTAGTVKAGSRSASLALLLAALSPVVSMPAFAQEVPASAVQPDGNFTTDGRERFTVFHQQARIIRLPVAAKRVAIADDSIADFRLLGPTDLYILGKSIGRTNLLVWDRAGAVTPLVIDVTVDVEDLAQSLRQQLPPGNRITVASSSSSIVLSGTVADAVSADAALRIAETYAINLNRIIASYSKASGSIMTNSGKPVELGLAESGAGGATSESDKLVRIINLMKIRDVQQVMLEVRIAEISKSLADRLGVGIAVGNPGGSVKWNIGSNFLGAGAATGSLFFDTNGTNVQIDIDAERKRGTFRILAEPAIVAMSGQEGSFLVGGKVLIPVTQSAGNNGSVTLEERQFGVGLNFLPIVLDGGRINLRVTPEVSELSKEPVTYGTGQSGAVLPAFTTSRVSTTVQLRSGQSLVIGGLLRNSTAKALKGIPILSEIPILGALFRSNDFTSDRTELVVVVKPTLVAATEDAPQLPTEELSLPRLPQLEAQKVPWPAQPSPEQQSVATTGPAAPARDAVNVAP